MPCVRFAEMFEACGTDWCELETISACVRESPICDNGDLCCLRIALQATTGPSASTLFHEAWLPQA